MCYKCNDLGHVAKNCHALDDQHNPRSITPICQLWNNSKHTTKYYRMDINFRERRKNGRDFKNRRNDRRNHERNTRTNNEEQRNIVSELQEELNEALMKSKSISKENLDDDEMGRSKSIVEFDSIRLN